MAKNINLALSPMQQIIIHILQTFQLQEIGKI